MTTRFESACAGFHQETAVGGFISIQAQFQKALTSSGSHEIAEDAALSRLRPIPDGPDQWEVHMSSAVSGSGGPAAHLDSDNVPI
jgi:hypothetical protein